MLGGTNKQQGGSLSLSLIRMSGQVLLGPSQLLAAGTGYFTLINLP